MHKIQDVGEYVEPRSCRVTSRRHEMAGEPWRERTTHNTTCGNNKSN